jgi:hypothetical protein
MTNREALLRVKTERANEHVRDLESRIETFWAEDAKEVVPEDQTEPGYINCRVQGLSDIPPYWGVLIGDALHNLRSALDHLIGHLIESNNGKISDSTQFPIKKTSDAFKSSLKTEVKGISDPALKVLKALKPYKGGNDLLWRLHRLNIADKHKMLVPVVAGYKSFSFDAVATMRAAFPDAAPWDEAGEMRIALRPDERCPLDNGDSLYRISLVDWPKTDQHPQFTFDIAFGKVEIVDCESVVDTLDELLRLTNEVIDKFIPLLS